MLWPFSETRKLPFLSWSQEIDFFVSDRYWSSFSCSFPFTLSIPAQFFHANKNLFFSESQDHSTEYFVSPNCVCLSLARKFPMILVLFTFKSGFGSKKPKPTGLHCKIYHRAFSFSIKKEKKKRTELQGMPEDLTVYRCSLPGLPFSLLPFASVRWLSVLVPNIFNYTS